MRAALAMVVVASLLVPIAASAETGCIVYQHADFAGVSKTMARNSFMQMGGGEPIGSTAMIDYYRPDWNDHISSFRVNGARQCKLTLYQHADRWGYGEKFGPTSSSYSYLGSYNDQASWVVCSCRGAPQH